MKRLPPDHPDAPKYWMYEASGVLAPVVKRYLEGADLAPAEIGAMRAYLRQWIVSPAWDMNPHAEEESRRALARLRRKVDLIRSQADIEEWLQSALEEEIDPL
jgi:hypothetical protein